MMLVIKKSVLVFIFCLCIPFASFESSEMNSLRFSTKTPYLFKKANNLNYEEFTPRKIWSIYRHGTRLPGKKVISKYFGLVDHIDALQNSTHLTNEEKEALQKWKPLEIKLDHQKYLTKEGEEELYKLGNRFKNQFMNNFSEKDTEFIFKHTPTQRTNLSARKFIEGLFEDTKSSLQPIEVSRDDPILRPYKGCPLWRRNVKKNPATLAEKRNLLESAEVENLINEMRDITQIKDLDFKDIELMYTMCGYETAWRHLLFSGKSIWCSLFKKEKHLILMEYLEDMEYYWIDGPGFEITRKVACNTVNDIIKFLDPSTQPSKTKSLSFYFTHSGTILKLLTFLELYQDDFQLTADKLNHSRLWRTSIIDSFSTNIIAILYDSSKYGPHVQLLHQENVVKIPNCDANEHGMCSYEQFKTYYENKISECNLSVMCNVKEEL